jgi:hypothetical protein
MGSTAPSPQPPTNSFMCAMSVPSPLIANLVSSACRNKNDVAAYSVMDLVRPFIISCLATALTACTSCFPAQQAQQAQRVSLSECTKTNGFACSDEAAATAQMDSKPLVLHRDPAAKTAKSISAKAESPRHRKKASAHIKNATSPIVPKTDVSSPAQSTDTWNTAINANPTVAAKTGTSSSAQLDDKVVIKKAKETVAAKMENPASVEFLEMNRAARTNTLGKSIDTICGYVKGKTTSGADTGERPFLYLVQEDEAYVVNGSGDIMATAAYRNICN